ncbi:efflux RND transporter periplasmic adaptor subunit [Gammaproteobacteria bacterium]|nr:efflux RND transporter periplasmic adaptor subunit [Gammaproteobacteria bacterium]MDA8856741.1 efflux RND transporter periplasmic adaptor subunit [Gammaproteobacteria bacterium]MDA8957302.1 efflux RND transporter periplasmic adaptor subunit [Gammaproteobacteria bacterium]MDA9039365.1 efflux RND transporter periplasmic adaptor subunit [Gammaproteobacteria bacterium]MDA9044968.1 efflux RND transporter periplasmic adaptor subunit [Gammaproteobacteria bacterium]|tara:strand:+ start:830 stop:1699 length:870 start_codon:yes stop_codon:yes gene_type:complete
MNKNIRISLAIFIIALLTLLSGQFEDEVERKVIKKELFAVKTIESFASLYQPLIKLKSTTISETRVDVKAKTSGEVVKIGSRQGDYVIKDSVLCSLGIVELNRTEVKAPFSGYLETIVKPGNFLERGQVCATIIQLDPITFVAEVPESDINKVSEGQEVILNLITGESILGNLSFVSKSASNLTRTFKVESEIKNKKGIIRDGITSEMIIKTSKIYAHKISPSILMLNDKGMLGIKVIENEDTVKFITIDILEDSEDGIWVTGLPDKIQLIIQGQGFVENNQKVLVSSS